MTDLILRRRTVGCPITVLPVSHGALFVLHRQAQYILRSAQTTECFLYVNQTFLVGRPVVFGKHRHGHVLTVPKSVRLFDLQRLPLTGIDDAFMPLLAERLPFWFLVNGDFEAELLSLQL